MAGHCFSLSVQRLIAALAPPHVRARASLDTPPSSPALMNITLYPPFPYATGPVMRIRPILHGSEYNTTTPGLLLHTMLYSECADGISMPFGHRPHLEWRIKINPYPTSLPTSTPTPTRPQQDICPTLCNIVRGVGYGCKGGWVNGWAVGWGLHWLIPFVYEPERIKMVRIGKNG